MRHVVMFSGGIGSWMTARRVADQHGTDDLVLLFADTLVEEPDLYRFLDQAADNVGAELVVVADGRTPFEVFHDDRFLGNQRLANCSKFLKQKPCRAWLEAECDPEDTTLYVGIDWAEQHRLPAIHSSYGHSADGCANKTWCLGIWGPNGRRQGPTCGNVLTIPWRVKAPMTKSPYMDKAQMLLAARSHGLVPPQSYSEGFPHANCMAQGCVRGGQAYWQNILRTRRLVFLATEQREQEIRRTDWGQEAAMLRDRRGGETKPMTLREFRERLEHEPELFDGLEWGGCGCFTEAV